MVDRTPEHWRPMAAYLYVLNQDALALAWEYLRRHPEYQQDWLRSDQRMDAAHRWGLRALEDPKLDARDAHPVWMPDHDTVLYLHLDVDPPPNSRAFEFWNIPGRKDLLHDGKRLVLVARRPGRCARLVLAPELEEGRAYFYAVRPNAVSSMHAQMVVELKKLAVDSGSEPAGVSGSRPAPASLLELRTLQALDATLAGASLREVADGLFGAEAVAQGWHADSGLRSRVRRLVRRGQMMMRDGYRRLAQIA